MRMMPEKKTLLPSLSKQDWNKVKAETEKDGCMINIYLKSILKSQYLE